MVDWKAFINGFSVGLFIVVLIIDWDNIVIIRMMAGGVVLLYGMMVFTLSRRTESKKEQIERKVREAWEVK